ncbi:MAG TPA: glycoside hydrolase domain-containing protein [Planctomycetota bacterium]|nr:glycoside hydrolase domain-containing protein [Planctomycetota bacterium]
MRSCRRPVSIVWALWMLIAPSGALAPPALAAGQEARLVLDESVACRAYYHFGWDHVNAQLLRQRGEEILGKERLKKLERETKRLLAHENHDWTKEDWRDHAVVRFVTISHALADSAERLRASRTEPPPAEWFRSDFDDAAWPRCVKPFGVGPNAGMWFSQWSMASPGLEAAFFRFRFEVPDPAEARELTLAADYVGGIRVFVNGEEMARGHLPKGDLGPAAIAEGYDESAYMTLFTELSDKDRERALKKELRGKKPPRFWGFADWRTPLGSRIYQARNRTLGPVAIPARLLRKGPNVLAIEVRAAPLHPMVLDQHAWLHGYGKSSVWLHASLSRLELRSSAASVPPGVSRPPGMQAWAEDMHHRVFSPEYLEPGANPGTLRFAGARNGTCSAQLVVGTDRERSGVKIVPGNLTDGKDHTIRADAIRVFGMAGSSARDIIELGGGRLPAAEGFYTGGGNCFPQAVAAERFTPPAPDPKARLAALGNVLYFDHITRAVPDKLSPNACQPYWLSFRIPADAAPGLYKGTVRVEAEDTKPVELKVEAEVADWRLPDPVDFQTISAIEHSPYAVAKQYETPLWSDEHFRLIEASLRELARIGNDWWFAPVILGTEFGNRDDSMIRWTRRKGGELAFDFRILDRYLDAIVKRCGPPRVVSFVVMHGAPGPVEVKLLDEATGKEERLNLGPENADRQGAWRVFANALYNHMKARGLDHAMYWGYGWDTEGDPKLKPLLRAAVPQVFWTYGSHSPHGGSGGMMEKCSLAYYTARVEIYGLEPGLKSQLGWKRQNICLLNPRVLSSCATTEGHSPPFNFRLMVDRALVSGYNGIGRIGGDYWAGAYYDGCRVNAYHQAGFSVLKTLWPGPDGAEPSVRFEATLEGIQEAEARIFIEQALERGLLPDTLAKSAREAVDAHNLETLHLPVHSAAILLTEGAQGWLDRSRRLYATAAEVAAAVGMDVATVKVQAAVPPLGQAHVGLKLRNWTARPRAWRAASGAPWIVPEATQGTATGTQLLRVRLDGKALEPEKAITGTLTITDVESGRTHPVEITAEVGKLFELSAERLILNVPMGEKRTHDGLTVFNGSGDELRWKAECPEPWLRAEPASGSVAPGAIAVVRLIAAPPQREGARLETTVALAVRDVAKQVDVVAYVIPSYQPPELPKGTPIWLLDAVEAKLIRATSHTAGGYNHEENEKLPEAKRAKPDGWPQTRILYRGHGVSGGPHQVYGADLRKLPYTMGDKQYLRGLWAIPADETTYDLAGSGLQAFSAEVGFNPEMQKGQWVNRSTVVSFEVYVDGALRAQSGLMGTADKPRLLVVNALENAKTIQLVTRRENGENDLRTLATWGDPTFYAQKPPPLLAELRRQELALWQDPPMEAIQQWAFLGPFPRDNDKHYPPEEKLDFAARHKGAGGADIAWRPVAAGEDGVLRLASVVKGAAFTTTYCAAVLESPKEQVVQFGLGAGGRWNSSFTAWLNGEPLYAQNEHMGGPKKNVRRVVAVLKPGANTLLIRLDEDDDTGGLVVTCRGDGLRLRAPK